MVRCALLLSSLTLACLTAHVAAASCAETSCFVTSCPKGHTKQTTKSCAFGFGTKAVCCQGTGKNQDPGRKLFWNWVENAVDRAVDVATDVVDVATDVTTDVVRGATDVISNIADDFGETVNTLGDCVNNWSKCAALEEDLFGRLDWDWKSTIEGLIEGMDHFVREKLSGPFNRLTSSDLSKIPYQVLLKLNKISDMTSRQFGQVLTQMHEMSSNELSNFLDKLPTYSIKFDVLGEDYWTSSQYRAIINKAKSMYGSFSRWESRTANEFSKFFGKVSVSDLNQLSDSILSSYATSSQLVANQLANMGNRMQRMSTSTLQKMTEAIEGHELSNAIQKLGQSTAWTSSQARTLVASLRSKTSSWKYVSRWSSSQVRKLGNLVEGLDDVEIQITYSKMDSSQQRLVASRLPQTPRPSSVPSLRTSDAVSTANDVFTVEEGSTGGTSDDNSGGSCGAGCIAGVLIGICAIVGLAVAGVMYHKGKFSHLMSRHRLEEETDDSTTPQQISVTPSFTLARPPPQTESQHSSTI